MGGSCEKMDNGQAQAEAQRVPEHIRYCDNT